MDFAKAGYREYSPGIDKDWAETLFQKRIVSAQTGWTKFFLNIYKARRIASLDVSGESYCARVQFRKDNKFYNVEELHVATLAETEKFFQELWRLMDMDYWED